MKLPGLAPLAAVLEYAGVDIEFQEYRKFAPGSTVLTADSDVELSGQVRWAEWSGDRAEQRELPRGPQMTAVRGGRG